MGYRNRIEILTQILEAVDDHGEDGLGVTQTTITYEIFLSSVQLKEYLTALTLHGLLDRDSDTRTYHITQKGLRCLALCNKLGEMIVIEKQGLEAE